MSGTGVKHTAGANQPAGYVPEVLATQFQFDRIAWYPVAFSRLRSNVVASIEPGFLPSWSRRGQLASSALQLGEDAP